MSNFTLAEMGFSDTAVRLGIDNSVPLVLIPVMGVTMDGMEQVRHLLGDKTIKVNSGYRCEALEKVLCAKDFARWCKMHSKESSAWPEYFATKAHPKGYAVDFTCSGFGTPKAIVAFLRTTGLKFDQLIEEGTWVHISFAPTMRGVVMAATFDKEGTPSYQTV